MQSRASYEMELSLLRQSATNLKGPLELCLLDRSAKNLKGPLTYSLILHVILFGTLICFAVFSPQPETWGGRASERGLKVIYLPNSGRYKKAPYLARLPKVPVPAPALKTASYVPHGNGIGGGAQFDEEVIEIGGYRGPGVIEVKPVGFAARFPQYVGAVQRRMSNNWLESISWVPRPCIATFTILRNGTIINIRLTQSSGGQEADMSVVHAIENSNPLDHLPAEYAPSSANVEFEFDFRRPQ